MSMMPAGTSLYKKGESQEKCILELILIKWI